MLKPVFRSRKPVFLVKVMILCEHGHRERNQHIQIPQNAPSDAIYVIFALLTFSTNDKCRSFEVKNEFFEETNSGIVISVLKSTRIPIFMNFWATFATYQLWLKPVFRGQRRIFWKTNIADVISEASLGRSPIFTWIWATLKIDIKTGFYGSRTVLFRETTTDL